MARAIVRNLDRPDEVQELPGVRIQLVDLGDIRVGRTAAEPGWRWSSHIRLLVGTEWCQVRHVGLVVAGRIRVTFQDGTVVEAGPGDVYDIPPGHDGEVIGDEPHVAIEWSGSSLAPREQARILAAVLFTDIVGSTARLQELGESRWRDLVAEHNEIIREAVGRSHGREIKMTGDGVLAVFDGGEAAIRAALRIRDRTGQLGLQLRLAIHVGEIELVGDDVRGLALHETARMLEVAGPGEIIVSSVARELTSSAGLTFDGGDDHVLRDVVGPRRLYRVAAVQPDTSAPIGR